MFNLLINIQIMGYKRHMLRHKSFNFSIEVTRYVRSLPKKQIYCIITDQLLRSTTSIGANIFEAKSAFSKKDFIKYYEIALKSTNETIYWIKLLNEVRTQDKHRIKELLSKVLELGKLLGSSIKTLKSSQNNFKF